MHAGGGTNDRGEKRNVLIVGVLLLIGSNISLRSNTQRRVQILRVRQAPVLLHVAGRPKPVMGDAEVKDQTPAPCLIAKIVAYLHIAAPLACACRDSMLCAHDVSGRAEQRPRAAERVPVAPSGFRCAATYCFAA